MNKLPLKFKPFLFFVFVAVSITTWANNEQKGENFLTNVQYQNNVNNFVWSITQSSRNTLLVASRTGVMEYNSEDWLSIETPDISLSLHASQYNDRIYTCGRNHIGYFKQNQFGEYVYLPINDEYSNIKGVFTDIFTVDSGLYFYGAHELLYYNGNSISSIEGFDSNTTFLGSFTHNNKLYLNILNKGAVLINDTTLEITKGLEVLNNQTIVFSCKFDNASTLIGTQTGKLFLLNSDGIIPFNIEDEEYLQKGVISDGLLFSGSQIAISFKNLGVLIVDKYTGKTIDIIDGESGLPDEFVTSLFAGKEQALWIAQKQGLSRMDALLPIKNYSSFFGIEGSIITSNFWNEKLYVATSEGVFLLDSISEYDTRKVYKKIPIVNNSPSDDMSDIISENNSSRGDEPGIKENISKKGQKKNRRGLFKRLFDSKEETNKNQEENEKSEPELVKPAKKIQKPGFEYFQYQKFILKSKQFGFSRIGELEERCSKLISLKEQLLAVTNTNIYSIDNRKNVTEIFSGSNILDLVLSEVNDKRIYVIDKEGLYVGEEEKGKWIFTLKTESNNVYNITSFAEISGQSFLLALNNQLVKVNLETREFTDIQLNNPFSESVVIKKVNEDIYVLVGANLYKVNKDITSLSKANASDNFSVTRAFLKQPRQFSIKTSENKYQYFGSDSISAKALLVLNIFNDIKDLHFDLEQNIWVINGSDEIYRLNTKDFQNYNLPCEVYLGEIEKMDGTSLSTESFILNYSENSLSFSLVSPSNLKLNSNQYQYFVEGLMEDWSEWSRNNEFTIPYLPAGSYQLKFRAKNILNEFSEIKSIQFRVLPPFWKTVYFYVLLIIIVGLVLYYWQKFRLKRLVKEKEILQEKVRERTEELQVKNVAITDSINYAGKIQKALLPPTEKLDSLLSEYFIYYKPKDIISGDFYLATQRKRYTVIIAADCTGHGVPGAFMSMLGMAFINDVLSAADASVTAAEILNTLRDKLISLLHQHITDSRDGMDMVVLLFDKDMNNLQYAGAHNPLYRLIPKKYDLEEEDKEHLTNENDKYYLLQYKGNRFQVGNSKKAHIDFTNHVIDYEDGEKFYIFSDGYADQFGGEEERKFMYGSFRKLLLGNAHKNMADQKAVLEETMKEWKKEYPQTDDILVFGMKP